MSLYLLPPFQALCKDRSRQAPVAPDPMAWIQCALPRGITTLNFQFFINWSLESFPIAGPFWLTQLLQTNAPDTIATCTDQQVFTAWETSSQLHSFQRLAQFCAPLRIQTQGIVLPELRIEELSNTSPVWRVQHDSVENKLMIERLNLSQLQAQITAYRGGSSAALGVKGLTYGTSAVECWMSTTGYIYPGDADCLLVRGLQPVALLEFKKHTLSTPLDGNLASRYYPRPDGRKYDSLSSLSRDLGQRSSTVIPIIIVYFATKFPKIRIQVVEVRTGDKILVKHDTGDIDVTAESPSTIGKTILKSFGIA